LFIFLSNQSDDEQSRQCYQLQSGHLKVQTSGIRTELVVVGDGVGRGRTRAQKHEGSGIAGIVLVLKVAGAFAATG
jgi:dihydroxyacetone kinase